MDEHGESYDENFTYTRKLGVEAVVSIPESCVTCMVLFEILAFKKLKNFLGIAI